jgi:hypothetical protein
VTALIVQRLWPRASAPARIEPARR